MITDDNATPTKKTPLERAIDIAGGASALASAIQVAASTPAMWKARGRVPAEHCAAIERVVGRAVTRQDLRPSDWQRIWPELVCDGAVCAATAEPAIPLKGAGEASTPNNMGAL